jgi:hypothetical protein
MKEHYKKQIANGKYEERRSLSKEQTKDVQQETPKSPSTQAPKSPMKQQQIPKSPAKQKEPPKSPMKEAAKSPIKSALVRDVVKTTPKLATPITSQKQAKDTVSFKFN